MANNRAYMRCRRCGAVLFIGKSYLRGFYYTEGKPGELAEAMNRFYDEHNYCGRPKVSGHRDYDEEAFPMPEDCDICDGSFDLVYEDGPSAGFKKGADTKC